MEVKNGVQSAEDIVNHYEDSGNYINAGIWARNYGLRERAKKIFKEHGLVYPLASMYIDEGKPEKAIELHIGEGNYVEAARISREYGYEERAQKLYLQAMDIIVKEDKVISNDRFFLRKKVATAADIAKEAGLLEKAANLYEENGFLSEGARFAEDNGLKEKARELYFKSGATNLAERLSEQCF